MVVVCYRNRIQSSGSMTWKDVHLALWNHGAQGGVQQGLKKCFLGAKECGPIGRVLAQLAHNLGFSPQQCRKTGVEAHSWK